MKRLFLFFLVFPTYVFADYCAGVDEGWKQSVNDFKQIAVDRYGPHIRQCSASFRESESVLFGILMTENVQLDEDYVHPESKATGPYQIIPATQNLIQKHSKWHLEDDLTDPRTSARHACEYMSFMRNALGIETAPRRIVGYNHGHNGVKELSDDEVYNHPYYKKVRCAIALMADVVQ